MASRTTSALYKDEPVDRLGSFPLWLNTHNFVILSLVSLLFLIVTFVTLF